MKKLLALILIAALILPAIALADPAEPTDKYATYGRSNDTDGLFGGDYFSIEVFMTEDLNAYILVTIWTGHDMAVTVKHAAIKTKKDDPGVLYLVFPDGAYYTYTYEDENQKYIWLNMDSGSIRLKYCDWLVPIKDIKGD